MYDIRVYHQNEASLYPKQGDDASGVVSTAIQNGVDLYIDPEAGRLIVKLVADTYNRTRQRVFVEYTPDQWTRVFERLSRRLIQIEPRHGDDDSRNPFADRLDDDVQPEASATAESGVYAFWIDEGEFDEPEYGLLYYLHAYADADLSDLGYNRSSQRAFRTFLERRYEFETLDQLDRMLTIGMTGYQATAVAARQFVEAWNVTVPFTVIDKDGQLPSVGGTRLYINVGSAANFEPVDDRSQELINQRYTEVQNNLGELFYGETEQAIEALVKGKAKPGPKCSDLDTLLEYVNDLRQFGRGRPDAEPTFELDGATAVRDQIDRIEGFAEGAEDAEALDREERTELRTRIHRTLQEKRDSLVEDIHTRMEAQLQSTIEELSDLSGGDGLLPHITALETQDTGLEAMQSLLDENAVDYPEGVAPEVREFNKQLTAMKSNEYLSGQDRTDIIASVEERIRNERKSARRVAGKRFRSALYAAVDEICEFEATNSIEEKFQRVKAALAIVDLSMFSTRDASPTSPAQSVDRLAEVVERLENSRLINPEDRPEFLKPIRRRLEGKREELRRARRKNLESQFKSYLNRLQEPNNRERAGYQLHVAHGWCTTDPDIESEPTDALQDFADFVQEVNRDPIIENKYEIHDSFKESLEEAESDLEDKKVEKVRDKFEKELDRLTSTIKRKDERFRRLEEVDDLLKGRQSTSDDKLWKVRQIIENLSGESGQYALVKNQDDVRADLRKIVQEKRTEIREQKADNLKSTFARQIENLKKRDASMTAVLDDLRELKGAVANPRNAPLTPLSNKSDAYNNGLKQIKELMDSDSLSSEQRGRVKESFQEKVDKEFNQYKEKYVDEISTHFSDCLDDIVEPASAGQGGENSNPEEIIQTLNKNIENLEDLSEYVDGIYKRIGIVQERLNGPPPLEEEDPEKLVDAVLVSSLDRSRKKNLIEEFRQEIKEKLDDQHQYKSEWLQKSIEQEITRILESQVHHRLDQKVDLLDRIYGMLDSPDKAESFMNPRLQSAVTNGDRLILATKFVSSNGQQELQQTIDNKLDDIVDEWKMQVVDDVTDSVGDMISNKDIIEEPLKQFEKGLPNPGDYSYETGECETIIVYDELTEAAEVIGRFTETAKQEHTRVTDQDVNEVEKQIKSEIDDLRHSERWGTEDKIIGFLRSVLPVGTNSSGGFAPGRVAVLIIVLFFIVVSIGGAGIVYTQAPGLFAGAGDIQNGEVTQMSVLVANGDPIEVQGQVTGTVSSVIVSVAPENGESGQTTEQPVEVSGSSFSTEIEIDSEGMYVITAAANGTGKDMTTKPFYYAPSNTSDSGSNSSSPTTGDGGNSV